jgi:hypothetical protein
MEILDTLQTIDGDAGSITFQSHVMVPGVPCCNLKEAVLIPELGECSEANWRLEK